MRRHNFVVGYRGEDQCVYGKQAEECCNYYIDLLTLPQAKKLAKKIFCQSGQRKEKAVIYKLVVVKTTSTRKG